ncbi:hypothetical protein Hanom_Chr12g01111831 [Helianthus anomalus]
MLGQAGNGKLRVSVGQSKLAAKVAKKYDPQADANRLGSGTQSTYFSETGTFSKINRT